MADEADLAYVAVAQNLQKSIAYRKPAPDLDVGYCAYCHEPAPGRRWCDAGCRDSWQGEQDLARRTGW